MKFVATTTLPAGHPRPPAPPLESGDRLIRAEFEQRYEAMPQLKKAELIDGIVFVGSPVRERQHGAPHHDLGGWLAFYRALTPGLRAADNTTVRLDNDNEPQPDLLLRILETVGGQSKVDEAGYIEGAPELVAEVAASSVSLDMHAKRAVYQRHGVREYVVWRVLDDAVDWFVLRHGCFECLEADADGILRSTVFPGLWLDPRALRAGDLAQPSEIITLGCKSAAHAAFLTQLKQHGS